MTRISNKIWNRKSSVSIKDYKKKVEFFYNSQKIGLRCIHNFGFASRKEMAQKLKLGDAQLEGSTTKGALSQTTLNALGRHLCFDPEWPEFRYGTVEEFAKRYNKDNWFQPNRRARLARGPRRDPCPSPIKGLAGIAIDGHQFGVGTVNIDLEVTCGSPYVHGCLVTVQAGLVELDCGSKGRLTKESWRGWLSRSPLRLENAHGFITLDCAGGARNKPVWRLAADGASIGNIVIDPDFAVLEDLVAGDSITARFGTWLMDIQTAGEDERRDDGGVTLRQRDGSQFPLATQEYSAVKRRVLDCIAKQAIPAEDGYVTLATHVLEVVEEELITNDG